MQASGEEDMSRKTAFKAVTAIAAACMGALAFAGCGASGTPAQSSAAGGDGELTPVSIALVKVAGSAPVFIADQEGFFEAEGLDVTIREVPGPAAVAALQNGEVQFASLGATVVVNAVAQGIPLTVVSGRTQTAQTEETDDTWVMVMPDSGISSAADLDGLTVGTQTLTSQNTLMGRVAVDDLGGDSESIQFVDVPMPDLMAALRSDSIQAAMASEPFVTGMEAAGAERLFGIGYNAFPSEPAPIGVIATQQSYAAENADIVAAFTRAFAAAVDWANEDEERLRAALPDLVGLPAENADAMILPTYTTTVTESGMNDLIDALVAQGFIEEKPATENLIP